MPAVGWPSLALTGHHDLTMHNPDARDAATVHRAALECEAIAADLERLKTLITDAGDRLMASFTVVGALAPRTAHNDDEQRTLATAVATAVTALQFQDMATQLTSHAQGRLTILQEELGRFCDGADPLLATTRLQPVRQAGMGAGSIDLF
jgi:hypothetical protein